MDLKVDIYFNEVTHMPVVIIIQSAVRCLILAIITIPRGILMSLGSV